MDTTSTLKAPDCFMKLAPNSTILRLVKEARRVKYIVEKDALFVSVHDNETNDLVFKACRMNRSTWVASFSKLYWQE